LSQAYAAVVTSGTATLETGLFKVPQVVVYKFQTLSFLIFRPFIWVKYFSLVNIIMKKKVVQELLQFGLARKINDELRKILYDEVYYNQMIDEYNILSDKIGKPGTSERAAKHMVEYLRGLKAKR
jgi:lipid-A-disaccharide synthase